MHAYNTASMRAIDLSRRLGFGLGILSFVFVIHGRNTERTVDIHRLIKAAAFTVRCDGSAEHVFVMAHIRMQKRRFRKDQPSVWLALDDMLVRER